jgi:predicted MFS family arabinose efflux permease
VRARAETAAASLAVFAAYGSFWGAWGALLPETKERVDASASELGLALLCIGLGALPAMLLAGVVLDRLGTRALAPIILLFAGTVLLPILAHSPAALALVLLVLGAASGALDVAANTTATAIEVATGRPLLQRVHAAFSVGVVAGSVSVGLARQAGATVPMVLAASAGVLGLAATANLGGSRPAGRRSARPILSRRLLVLGGLCAAAFVIEGGVENWSALFLETDLDAEPALSGLGPAVFAASMATGRAFGHGLGPRLGERRLLQAGASVAVVGLAAAALAPHAWVALAGFCVTGAGVAVAAPVLFGAGGRGASPAERGGAVATVTTIGYLGFLAGPPLLGGAVAAIGLRAAWVVLAVVAAGLAAGAARTRRL